MDMDEKRLVGLYKQGDLSAYDQLMARYEKKVYALCFRMAGNHSDAEDLAQEAFLKTFRALPSFKGDSQFSTWLYRIVTNTCLDERRKRAKKPVLVSIDKPLDTEEGSMAISLPGNAPDPLAETISGESQAEIQNLLLSLSPDQRVVLVMRDIEGYSYEEIAAALNINMGTVKSRLNRARCRMRELYLNKAEHFVPVIHLKGKGGLSHDL
jgi:RNA polymerase sigma-70 factor (ECF subfamily)